MDLYNRKGESITMAEWDALLRTKDDGTDERRVDETTLPDGVWISTVWLGLDHSFGSGPPLIFETMVFQNTETMVDLDCVRYSTEEEAQAGHEAMVTKWTGWTPGDPHPDETPNTEPTDIDRRLDEHRKRYSGASYVLSDDVKED